MSCISPLPLISCMPRDEREKLPRFLSDRRDPSSVAAIGACMRTEEEQDAGEVVRVTATRPLCPPAPPPGAGGGAGPWVLVAGRRGLEATEHRWHVPHGRVRVVCSRRRTRARCMQIRVGTSVVEGASLCLTVCLSVGGSVCVCRHRSVYVRINILPVCVRV
jgi:hypothetical protein